MGPLTARAAKFVAFVAEHGEGYAREAYIKAGYSQGRGWQSNVLHNIKRYAGAIAAKRAAMGIATEPEKSIELDSANFEQLRLTDEALEAARNDNDHKSVSKLLNQRQRLLKFARRANAPAMIVIAPAKPEAASPTAMLEKFEANFQVAPEELAALESEARWVRQNLNNLR